MIGPIVVPIKAVMAPGFVHEFRLFIEGRCVAIIKTEPPNKLMAWEEPFDALEEMEALQRSVWSLVVGDWVLDQCSRFSGPAKEGA